MLNTSIAIDCGFIMPFFSEKAQTKMQIFPWALVWASNHKTQNLTVLDDNKVQGRGSKDSFVCLKCFIIL